MKTTYQKFLNKMMKSQPKTQQETILHFWNIGIRTAKGIHKATQIPMRTIYNNIKKLEEVGDLDHFSD